MTTRTPTNPAFGFCASDVFGICQATIAVIALFGTLYSVGLL